MDVAKILEKQNQSYSSKPAIIFRDSTISFWELRQQASKVRNGLAALGIGPDLKTAIFLPNIPEYIFSLLGVFMLRAVCVPLDFMLTEEELVNFIHHSESKVLIAQEKKGIELHRIKKRCPSLQYIITLGEVSSPDRIEGFFSWKELLEKEEAVSVVRIKEEDHAAIFYTSGSTGHPKGVLLTYAHLDNPIETLEYFLHPTDKESLICAGVPFSHIGGLDYMLFMLYFGMTLVLMERFQPLEFLKNIEKHKVSIFCIVPSMYVAVLSLKEYDKFDLSSLKFAVVFGAPSSALLLERFHKVCPNAYLLNGWGMTETAAPNAYLPTGTEAKEIENTGKFPPWTEAKIVDEKGRVLKEGQEGELWLRGKAIMAGYYKEPQLTRQVLTPDSWLKTGDIARLDAQGRYSIVGRKKDMIKVAGEIVFSPEVEEVLQRHPQVKEAAVLGVADKMRGEVPKAFIVLKEGEKLQEEQLRYFLRQHLAHFKIPHYFEFVPLLPKNRVGKIDKEKLRQEAVC